MERLVEQSDAGRTHSELHVRLQVRVHNTLLDLVEAKRIGRETLRGHYLYVNSGLGASFPVRLRCPAEIACLTLRRETEWIKR